MNDNNTRKPLYSYLGQFLTSKTFLRVIGLLIFFWVLWSIDFSKVKSVLLRASIPYILMGLILAIPIILVRSYRWNRIKRLLDLSVRYTSSCYYQVVGQMAFLTPGKVGEFIKAFYLKGKGYSLGRSVVSIIGDRLLDLTVVILTSVVASFYFFPTLLLEPDLIIGLSAVLLLLSAGLVIQYRHQITRFLFDQLLKFLPDWLEIKIENLVDSLLKTLRRLNSFEVLLLFVLSLAAFAVQVLRIYFFALSLGIEVAFLPMCGIIAIMSFTNLLPISFMGLGTRDAVFLYFFGLLGVIPERAIGLSLIILASLVLNTAIGALLFTLNPPAVNVRDYLARQGNPDPK